MMGAETLRDEDTQQAQIVWPRWPLIIGLLAGSTAFACFALTCTRRTPVWVHDQHQTMSILFSLKMPPVVAAIQPYAESMYSPSTAEAFALLSLLSYCGPLPVVRAAARRFCSTDEASPCKRAHFILVPGTLRMFRSEGLHQNDASFGFLASLRPLGPKATISSGVLIVVRESISAPSGFRAEHSHVAQGLSGCEGCGVHAGYYMSFRKLEQQLMGALWSVGCKPAFCRIYVTGHGAGAAVGSIIAWELSVKSYSIGTSYLFSAPRTADEIFAREMAGRFMGQMEEPIFHVVYGRRSSNRPLDKATFKPWGFEAYYEEQERWDPNLSAAPRPSQICIAGGEDCGIQHSDKRKFPNEDFCNNPLAPGSTWCKLDSYMATCYAGMSFQAARKATKNLGSAEATWSKVDSALGTQQRHNTKVSTSLGPKAPMRTKAASSPGALHRNRTTKLDPSASAHLATQNRAERYFDLFTLEAFAGLVKLSYCAGPLALGLPMSVPNSCMGLPGSRCANAGFRVVPGTVVPMEVNGTLFFYTALIRRTPEQHPPAPFFMPFQSCVLVIRGTVNDANVAMDFDNRQVKVEDSACTGCTVNNGMESAWQMLLKPQVFEALKRSGCEARSREATSDRVILAGHSMGGTMSALLLYHLHKAGFKVQLSWAIEGGRPGNPQFMKYVNEKILADVRPVPFWVTTHAKDGIPRTAASNFAGGPDGRAQFMVHFPHEDTTHVFCTSKADMANTSTCGIYQWATSQLHMDYHKYSDHCKLPFAPSGDICFVAPVQCFSGL